MAFIFFNLLSKYNNLVFKITFLACHEALLVSQVFFCQDAQMSLRRLGTENESLEQRITQLESERAELQEQTNQGALQMKHTQELLNR